MAALSRCDKLDIETFDLNLWYLLFFCFQRQAFVQQQNAAFMEYVKKRVQV